MDTFLQASFATKGEAELAVRELREKGVPEESIDVFEAAEPKVDAAPPVEAGLGWGVPADAVNALVAEHAGESALAEDRVYVVNVDTAGDPQVAAVTREFFGYVA